MQGGRSEVGLGRNNEIVMVEQGGEKRAIFWLDRYERKRDVGGMGYGPRVWAETLLSGG